MSPDTTELILMAVILFEATGLLTIGVLDWAIGRKLEKTNQLQREISAKLDKLSPRQ